MDKPVAAPAAGAKEKVEKQARQLAYDTRYKVKQSMKAKAGGRIDPAAMRKAFISQLAKSPSAPAIKARAKQMLMGEGYIDVKDLVQEHASKALFKVFVEHHKKDENGNTIPHEGEEISEGKDGEKTYKVRVTDKKTGNSYVRMASRAKIADLRNNPNISSVEMTGYGEPTKSEKYKGSSTSKVKKGLDPVGKEDGDVNNDGKKDSTDSYLMNRRKAIGKAMAKEDKVWAGFKELIEKKEEKEKKITGEGVNNAKLIKVFPDEVKEEMEKKEEPKEDQGLKQKQRKANMAKKQVLMKKMQAVRMGAGDQIMASHEPEGEKLVEDEHEDKVRSQIKNLNYGAKSEADYEAAARASADASARRRRQKENAAKVRRSEMGAARRREARNELRRQGKYKGPMESVEVDEGMLVNVAKGVESGVKKFNKFDDKVTKSFQKKVVKPAVKNVKKVAKKTGMAVLRGTAGAVGGAIKGAGQGAMKGIKKGLKEEEMMKDQVVDKKKKKEEDDPRSMPTKVNLVKNKMRAMGLNMEYQHGDGLVDAYMQVHNNISEDPDTLSRKAYDRAKKLGAKRRASKDPSGIYKSERAGYNLSQSQKSRNVSPATQGGPQTGGGPKDFGFARNKKNPVKSKSVGDTGGIGHQKKADTKITTKKDGKTPLKTPRYKYSTKQRDKMGFYGRMEKRDPKKNPKHTANK